MKSSVSRSRVFFPEVVEGVLVGACAGRAGKGGHLWIFRGPGKARAGPGESGGSRRARES